MIKEILIIVFLTHSLCCPDPGCISDLLPKKECKCFYDGRTECCRNNWYYTPYRCLSYDEAPDEYMKIHTTEWKCRKGTPSSYTPNKGEACEHPFNEMNATIVDFLEPSSHWSYPLFENHSHIDPNPDWDRACIDSCPFQDGYAWVYFWYFGETDARREINSIKKWSQIWS